MNANARDIVAALVDLSSASPQGAKLLREIRDELSKHVSDEGSVSVVLITPSGQEAQLATAVQVLVKKHLNRDVHVTERANPALIGGAVVQIGDQQIDLSIRGALAELESRLQSA